MGSRKGRPLRSATASVNAACRAWASSGDPLAENQARDGGAEDLAGFCGEASCVLAEALAREGFRTELATGLFRTDGDAVIPHAWVLCGGFLLDPTAGQFGHPGGWRVLSESGPAARSYLRGGPQPEGTDPLGVPWFVPVRREACGLDPVLPRRRAAAVMAAMGLPLPSWSRQDAALPASAVPEEADIWELGSAALGCRVPGADG